MEEGAGGHRGDECVPGRDAGVIERSQSDRHGNRSGSVRGQHALRWMARSETDRLGKHAVHAVPGEIAQQPVKTRRHATKVGVVAKARLPAAVGDARLVGINLPWMEIEDAGTLPVHQREALTKSAIGQQTEIATARARPVAAECPQRRLSHQLFSSVGFRSNHPRFGSNPETRKRRLFLTWPRVALNHQALQPETVARGYLQICRCRQLSSNDAFAAQIGTLKHEVRWCPDPSWIEDMTDR